MHDAPRATLWNTVAEFPLFVLQLFVHPRSLLELDFEDTATRQRIALFCLISLAIIVAAFSDNRVLAEVERPLLSTFKGIVMRAHVTSWDWLGPVYAPFNLGQREAMRLWDTLLTTGFLAYTMFASLIGTAVVARIRMAWRGVSWWQALGTGMLGQLTAITCIALSLVPLAELLICRECVIRGTLFVLLNVAGWIYMGYYALGDWGQLPQPWLLQLRNAFGYGFILYMTAYVVFLTCIVAIIPM